MLVFCHFPPTHASDLACASKASLKWLWRAVWHDLRLFSRRHGRHQLFHVKDVERPAQIVGKRRQAELGAHLLEATHEEGPLVHPLLDPCRRDARRSRDAGRESPVSPSVALPCDRARPRFRGARRREHPSCSASAARRCGKLGDCRNRLFSIRAVCLRGSASALGRPDKCRRSVSRRSGTRPCGKSCAERCAAYSLCFFLSASIFSVRFLTREPPVARSSASPASSRFR